MKLGRANMIFGAVCKAMDEDTNYSFAHALCMAKKRLEEHARFYSEEELKLVSKYAMPREDGSIVSPEGEISLAPETAAEYFEKHKELADVEVSVDKLENITPPEKISGKTLELLMEIMGFVESAKTDREGDGE